MRKRISINRLIAAGMTAVVLLSTAVPVMADEFPYGLAGMNEGFVLDRERIADKEALIEHDVAGTVASLTADVDYEDHKFMFSADSLEYAEEVVAAYNARIESYAYGIAVAEITDPNVTVAQIVAVGADLSNNLPAVSPIYIIPVEEPIVSDVNSEDAGSDRFMGNACPEWSWTDVVNEYNDPAFDPQFRYPEYWIDYDDEGNPIIITPEENEYMNGYMWMHDVIGTYEAWGTTRGSNKVTVAVIDTGIDTEHEDLQSNEIRTVSNIPEEDQREILGGKEPFDTMGHGTHVAGIIGMTPNNGKGGVGVAPDVNILGISISHKYTDEKGQDHMKFDDVNIARAINYVAGSGSDSPRAQIINFSYGEPYYCLEWEKAVQNALKKNVTMVVSMGNGGTNDINYPAACEGVIAVTSVDRDQNRSDFSSYGEWATIAAPGGGIFSTWNGHDENSGEPYSCVTEDHNDWYSTMSGTSMSAPVVSGVCALFISEYYEKYGKYPTTSEVKNAIVKSATKNPDKLIGAGIVNAAALFADTAKDKETSTVKVDFKKNASDPDYQNLISGTELYEDSIIRFSAPGNVRSFHYLYTVNGSNPVMKDAVCAKGTFKVKKPEGGDDYVIDPKDLMAAGVGFGDTFTLKAAYVSAKGNMGQVVTVKNLKLSGNKTTVGTDLVVYGPTYVTMGKSVTYTAALDPSDPSFLKKHKAKWSLVEEVPGVSISAVGKLSVKKTVNAGTVIKVQASLDDVEDILPAVVEVTVKPPVTGVTADAREQTMSAHEKKVYLPVTKKGTLSSIRLYTVDLPETEGTRENAVYVDINTNLGEQSEVSYASSNPAVAYVLYDGEKNSFVVKSGGKAGTAKITFAADDGSGKKTSFTVKTIIPVSAIKISSKDRQRVVAYGKSMQLTSTPGNAYGRPSIPKVKWDYAVLSVFTTQDGRSYTENITQMFKTKKLATISASGKFSLSKKAAFKPEVPAEAGEGYAFRYFSIMIWASSTDGTDYYDYYIFDTTSPAKSISAYVDRGESGGLQECKAFNINSAEYEKFSPDKPLKGTIYIEMSGMDNLEGYCVNGYSTNPHAMKFIELSQAYRDTIEGRDYIALVYNMVDKGKGKLIIKAMDGSGKKLEIPFNIY